MFELDHARPEGIAPAEWQARVELAACYRLFDALGWTEGIYNHITLRVPGEDGSFLINPYGLHYAEVTAGNLVKVAHDGRVLAGSHPVNAAGMVIHVAVHAARADVACVMHTHTTSVMAVACKVDGLRSDNFYSAQLAGRIGYHGFEGLTTRPDEGPRLIAALGQRTVLMLRSHGVVVVGPALAEAFATLWQVQRACDVQRASDAMAGPNQPIAPEVLAGIGATAAPMRSGSSRSGELLFAGLVRRAGIRGADLLEPGP